MYKDRKEHTELLPTSLSTEVGRRAKATYSREENGVGFAHATHVCNHGLRPRERMIGRRAGIVDSRQIAAHARFELTPPLAQRRHVGANSMQDKSQ